MLEQHGLPEPEAPAAELRHGMAPLSVGETLSGATRFASGAGRRGSFGRRPDRTGPGLWSLVKRDIGNLAAADLTQITPAVKRELKMLQYRPAVIDGCFAGTGLALDV